ncbi:17676_t:CDS:2 [Funneliformis geosporum]|nr:17676_t:CDS:2 [Funneliformis geosporum]
MVIHKSSPVLHVKKVKRRNLEKAFYWYQQASDSEYGLGKNKPWVLSAQINFGDLYERGEGIEKNLRKAFYWNKQQQKEAIKLDNAKFYLGYCYINGIGTRFDIDTGFKLYIETSGRKYEEFNKVDLSLLPFGSYFK